MKVCVFICLCLSPCRSPRLQPESLLHEGPGSLSASAQPRHNGAALQTPAQVSSLWGWLQPGQTQKTDGLFSTLINHVIVSQRCEVTSKHSQHRMCQHISWGVFWGVRLMCQIYATLRLKIDAIHRCPCILYAAVDVINISSQEFSTKTNTVTVEKVVIMFL